MSSQQPKYDLDFGSSAVGRNRLHVRRIGLVVQTARGGRIDARRGEAWDRHHLAVDDAEARNLRASLSPGEVCRRRLEAGRRGRAWNRRKNTRTFDAGVDRAR